MINLSICWTARQASITNITGCHKPYPPKFNKEFIPGRPINAFQLPLSSHLFLEVTTSSSISLSQSLLSHRLQRLGQYPFAQPSLPFVRFLSIKETIRSKPSFQKNARGNERPGRNHHGTLPARYHPLSALLSLRHHERGYPANARRYRARSSVRRDSNRKGIGRRRRSAD